MKGVTYQLNTSEGDSAARPERVQKIFKILQLLIYVFISRLTFDNR